MFALSYNVFVFYIENYCCADQPIPSLIMNYIVKIFSKLDVNDKKYLDFEQLKSFMINAHENISDSEIKDIFGDLDVNKDNKISFVEFARYITKYSIEVIQDAFEIYDTNKDGLISEEELHEKLRKLGHNLNRSQIKEIIKNHDVDGDGCISFDEFKLMISME